MGKTHEIEFRINFSLFNRYYSISSSMEGLLITQETLILNYLNSSSTQVIHRSIIELYLWFPQFKLSLKSLETTVKSSFQLELVCPFDRDLISDCVLRKNCYVAPLFCYFVAAADPSVSPLFSAEFQHFRSSLSNRHTRSPHCLFLCFFLYW